MPLAKKIRINVFRRDAQTLEFMQATSRALYNWQMSQWKAGAQWSLTDGAKSLQHRRVVDPDINAVYGKLLQQVFFQLDEALRGLFRRIKAGATPGLAHYHLRQKFFTLKYPGMYFGIGGKRLILPTGGREQSRVFPDIRARLGEAPPQRFGEMAITQDAQGRYDAILLRETPQTRLDAVDGGVIAYDGGVKTLATGYCTTRPLVHVGGFTTHRWYNKQLDRMRSWRCRCQEESRRYRDLTRMYHCISEQKPRKQRDFLRKASAFLTRQAECAIVWGDLSPQPMAQQSRKENLRTKGVHCLVQNEWGLNQFVQMVPYKVQRFGKMVHIISERDCPGCGYRQDMASWSRTYQCPHCGLVMDGDENAARDILARFLAWLGPYSAQAQNDVLSIRSGI